MAAYRSAGRALVIWAATVDPADVPMIRSASVRSTPASARPAIKPSCQALPAAPPPARTRARVFEDAAVTGGAFRVMRGGRSGWRLARSRGPETQGSAHDGSCGHGSHLPD